MALTATQVSKPLDEHAFERLSVLLWRAILADPTANAYARRGQAQQGVDIHGRRNGKPSHHVGIQCKCKSEGAVLTEKEVKGEVEKARTFRPALKEYFITTTAPDDGKLQELARLLTEELQKDGLDMQINVWGWNTLEREIQRFPDVEKEFDSSYTRYGERLEKKFDDFVTAFRNGEFCSHALTASVTPSRNIDVPGDEITEPTELERHIDNQINRYRTLIQNGKPRRALSHLTELLKDLPPTVSGRIHFRIKANIGHCYYDLGEDKTAADYMLEAYDHAPHERRAIANKAFGLLLRGDWAEVVDFGRRELLGDPENDELAGFLVQAAIFDEACHDPLPWVPENLRQSPAVAIAMVEFLRRRGKPGEWQMAAKNAWTRHPEAKLAARFAAEADINEIVTDENFFRAQVISENDHGRLADAVAILIDQWEHIRTTDGQVRPEDAALCGNILVALRRMCDLPKALEIAKQGVAVAPTDENLLIRSAIVAIDSGDGEFARDIVSKLPPGRDTTQLKIALYSSNGDTRALAELLEKESETIPDVERIVVDTTCELDRLKSTPSDQLQVPVDALMARIANDPRANILLASFARERGLEAVALSAFTRALTAITPDSHMAPRVMVALHAVQIGEWRIVADLLDEHLAQGFDSEELRALATAMANDHPIRQRAVRFFLGLPAAIREKPFYKECEAVMELNRGEVANAEKLVTDLLPCATASIYLLYYHVLDRTDRLEEFKSRIGDVDLRVLTGNGSQKLAFAQILYRLEMYQQASDFAFAVVSECVNDPEVVLQFISLFLTDTKQRLIPETEVIGVDCWVFFKESTGEIFDFLIGSDGPEDKILPIDQPLAKIAMGHKVGDELLLPVQGGDPRRLTVDKIQDKRLRKLHDLIARFNVRFPGTSGLTRIRIAAESDLEPLLKEVRQISETNRRYADLYLTQRFPAHMVASLLKADPVSFADFIRSLNGDIRVCNGLPSERDQALRSLNERMQQGAVLDTYTAWVVSTLGIFDILKAIFGELLIAASDLDLLRMAREENRSDGKDTMTISWVDGQYIRHVETPESRELRYTFIDYHLKNIEHHCSVRSSTAPDNQSPLVEQCISCFGSHIFDTAFLAKKGYYLISEDLFFRELAQKELGVNGCWLQAIVYFALLSNIITRQRYSDVLVELARLKHSHLFTDFESLVGVLQRDDTDGLLRFKALAGFIGGPSADIISHLSVSIGFLFKVWTSDDVSSLKRKRASSFVLERLLRGRTRDWPAIIQAIQRDVPRPCRQFTYEWMRGHFMFITENSQS